MAGEHEQQAFAALARTTGRPFRTARENCLGDSRTSSFSLSLALWQARQLRRRIGQDFPFEIDRDPCGFKSAIGIGLTGLFLSVFFPPAPFSPIPFGPALFLVGQCAQRTECEQRQ